VPPLRAQSIAYQALDYAAKLGFRPNPEFPDKIFGPVPDELEKTPWSAEERPLYVMGLRDDVDGVLATLDASVGAGNYDVVDPMDLEFEEDVIGGGGGGEARVIRTLKAGLSGSTRRAVEVRV
jgi:hypothetical protein